MLSILLLLYLITTALSITIQSYLPSSHTPFLYHSLNNYWGCKQWSQGHCMQCSTGFYFNSAGICCEVDENCRHFNRAQGICEQCYLGYEVIESKCLIKKKEEYLLEGCRVLDKDRCKQCSYRWFWNASGFCEPVNDLCRKWNKTTGLCTACYLGHFLKDGSCSPILSNFISDPGTYCAFMNQNKCQRCQQKAFFSPIGICIPVQPMCKTWDLYEGYCVSCQKGFDLEGGTCISSNKFLKEECDFWDENKEKCIKCPKDKQISKDGTFRIKIDGCQKFNGEDSCIKCFQGFSLLSGSCQRLVSSKTLTHLGCKIWDFQISKCLLCSSGWVFNQDSQCVPFFDPCFKYQLNHEKCQVCSDGYALVNSKCIITEQNISSSIDPGCKIWNYEKQACEQCSYRWYLNLTRKCEKVSDFCKQFEKENCTACYQGYELVEGKCIQQVDKNCAVKSSTACLECDPGYFMNEGKCRLSNPLCKSSNIQGECTSCYSMFVIYNRVCVPLQKLANLAQLYATCCPQKLNELKRMGRVA